MLTILPLVLGASLTTPSNGDDAQALMLRSPDVSATHVVFTYANDLWVVGREGGVALPVASPSGVEGFPKFSPDGSHIAFMGNYEGNTDLYVIPTTGGRAHRVTYHDGTEVLNDWTADRGLLYHTNSQTYTRRITQLYTVSPEGGPSTKLPPAYGAFGSMQDGSSVLAFIPITRDGRTWKRYRGGMASDIWLLDLESLESTQITDWEGTDSIPMWAGDKVYYLSDAGAEHRLNIWQYDTKTKSRTQVTRFEADDIRWPSMGPGPTGEGELVFQHGTSLKLLNLATRDITSLNVTIPGDSTGLRVQTHDASESVQSAGISSTGKRVAVEARGDLWSLPSSKGSARNLTRSNDVAERMPSWSPDGRWIAYFGDATGEYELYVTQSDGKGDTRQVTKGSTAYLTDASWSPDSKWITFQQNSGDMILCDVESGEQRVVHTSPLGNWSAPNTPAWSHDSRWFAYDGADDKLVGHIILYDTETHEQHTVTAGMFADSNPVFDRKGDYLYYVSDREFSPSYSSLDSTFIYDDSQRLIAVPLRPDVDDPWPLESDEEEWAEDDDESSEESDADEAAKPASDDDDAAADDDDAADDDGVTGTWEGSITGDSLPDGPMTLSMDLVLHDDGSLTGTAVVPVGNSSVTWTYDAATGAITGTVVGEDGMTFQTEATLTNGSITGTLVAGPMTLNFTATRKSAGDDGDSDADDVPERVEITLEGFEARGFLLPTPAGSYSNLAVNHQNHLLYVFTGGSGPVVKSYDIGDDSKMAKDVLTGVGGFDMSGDGKKLLYNQGDGFFVADAGPGASGKPVPTAGMMVQVDPRKEWRQVFRDAWRLNRQYFYDPTMHGVDWKAVHDHYGAMIEACSTRDDVEFILGEMVSELNVGHAYIRGAPGLESGDRTPVGALGVDFAFEDGAYRIATIHRGAPWDTDARSPFDRPGVDVQEGMFLLAVNGAPLEASMDPYAALQGLAGVAVTLTVSDQAKGGETRDVRVMTLQNDSNLRYRAWIERNRAYVDEKSGGRVGYIYVPDTQVGGQNDLYRQFQSQVSRDAIIIDERWNSGGQIPTRFIELLSRTTTNYWAVRGPSDLAWPPVHHRGPKCMLINGWSGSGGDAFPAYFRQAGLGKLIGRRTWGGLVGISGNPTLIDGGTIAVPTFAFYETDGTWGIEGHGVDPDMDVLDDPALLAKGIDPQLDAGIAMMLEELASRPEAPGRPDYPDRSGMGLPDSDK